MLPGPLLGLLLGFAPGAAIGVGRFAYALVLPTMQLELGLGFAEAGLIGSANTAGYLAGALLSHRLLAAAGYRRGVYGALLLQTLLLALTAASSSLPLLLAVRLAQGVLGALVFVGGAALLLAAGGRAVATGIYFGGVGLGIVASPLLLPLMTDWRSGWLLMAALSLLLTLPTLLAWPRLREPPPRQPGERADFRRIVLPLLAYGLYGAGYIGYMTFVTTGLPVPLLPFWLLLGVGALLTGQVWGRLIERIGGGIGLPVVLLVLAGSSLPPLVATAPWLSAFGFGMSFLGAVTAVTDIFRRTLPAWSWPHAMGLSTAAFALGQAGGPTVSGLAGELTGGPAGALWVATLLLAAGLLLALPTALAEQRRPPRLE